jgi:hypothetical protein
LYRKEWNTESTENAENTKETEKTNRLLRGGAEKWEAAGKNLDR